MDESITSKFVEVLAGLNKPRVDLIINGGWPFVNSIPRCSKLGFTTAFIDFGVVPYSGYPADVRSILLQHKANRRRCLKHADLAIAISDFILNTQTIPDTQRQVPAATILLGADHLAPKSVDAARSSVSGQNSILQGTVRVDPGCKYILNVGRWEPGCYKQSDMAYAVLQSVAVNILNPRLLVLADKTQIFIPAHLEGLVIPIGNPSDDDLVRLINSIDLGICMSSWEGFNLPLAELQREGKPCLVFRTGAHPEVVANEWLLCDSVDEMASKSIKILSNSESICVSTDLFGDFNQQFTWKRFFDKFDDFVDSTLFNESSAKPVHGHRQILSAKTESI